jgi:hypothetical protein
MSTCRLCQLFTDSSAGSSSETKTGTNVEYDLRFFLYEFSRQFRPCLDVRIQA